jgi:pyruvate,water dikinase
MLASLFTDRDKYRYDMAFDKMDIAISVGVQQMVRSDKGSGDTIDPDSGFKTQSSSTDAGVWRNIVRHITPDEWMILSHSTKPRSESNAKKMVRLKRVHMIYSDTSKSDSAET